jgi:hypothetical protein
VCVCVSRVCSVVCVVVAGVVNGMRVYIVDGAQGESACVSRADVHVW